VNLALDRILVVEGVKGLRLARGEAVDEVGDRAELGLGQGLEGSAASAIIANEAVVPRSTAPYVLEGGKSSARLRTLSSVACLTMLVHQGLS